MPFPGETHPAINPVVSYLSSLPILIRVNHI
jgi:hypothetical protein